MSWAYLALSVAGGLLTLIGLRPPRRGHLSSGSFVPGWLISELPVHAVVIQLLGTLGFWAGGAFDQWPGRIGLLLALASWIGLGWLAVAASRARLVLAKALETGLGGRSALPASPARRAERPLHDLLRIVVACPVRPRAVEITRGIDYWGDGAKAHRLDILRPVPPSSKPAPVLMFIHGGAWVMGDKRQQGLPLMHHLAAHGWVCVTVNYRLSPQATWPDHLVDCKRALGWVHDNIAGFGGDPSRVAVSGGSAGGHLAAMVGLTQGDPRFQAGLDDLDTTVAACVPLYGVYDFCDRDKAHVTTLMPLIERRILKRRIDEERALFEQASPVDQVRADAPPFFVIHGRNDTLVPVATARSFATALAAISDSPVAYAELPFAQHAFEVFWSMRTAATTRAIEDFLVNVLSSRTSA